MTSRRTHARVRRGFSLIEVLMAVFILALGLLGLGAVFPVVIREQRLGHDAVLGTTVASSARALLAGYDYTSIGARDLREFWVGARDHVQFGLGAAAYDEGQWRAAEAESASTPSDTPGQIRLPTGGPQLTLRLPNRLWPAPLPPSQSPQFVWDFAFQRVVDANDDPTDDGVRIAIFVRRLDPRIRINPKDGLYRQLTALNGSGAVDDRDKRVPVAVDEDGMPTFDGVGEPPLEYANLRTVRVEFRATRAEDKPRDRLYFDTSDPNGGNPRANVPWRLARQVGQKLVDNLGNVYSVIEVGKTTNGDEYVRIAPPVPASIPETSEIGPSGNTDLVAIREVLLSPQVPAAVLLWRVVQ